MKFVYGITDENLKEIFIEAKSMIDAARKFFGGEARHIPIHELNTYTEHGHWNCVVSKYDKNDLEHPYNTRYYSRIMNPTYHCCYLMDGTKIE